MTPLSRTLAGALAAGLVGLTLLTPATAYAAKLSVSDPAGDTLAPGLDLRKVAVDNQARHLVVRIAVTKAVAGNLTVAVSDRVGDGVRLVSHYRPGSFGHTSSEVISGSFARPVVGSTDDGGTVSCGGFHVDWKPSTGVVTMVMPAHCLARGDYRDLRFAVLTERPGGSDVDYAPQNTHGYLRSSAWFHRG